MPRIDRHVPSTRDVEQEFWKLPDRSATQSIKSLTRVQLKDNPLSISPIVPPAIPPWFWDDVVGRYSPNSRGDAIYTLFDKIDLMLSGGKFSDCDRMLRNLPIEDLPTEIIGGILSITLPATPDELPSRAEFFRRVYREIERRGEDARRLLAGLE